MANMEKHISEHKICLSTFNILNQHLLKHIQHFKPTVNDKFKLKHESAQFDSFRRFSNFSYL